MVRKILRRFFHVSHDEDFFGDLRDISFADGRLRRSTAYVLCFVIVGLTGFSIVLNMIRQNNELLAPLWLVVFVAVASLMWLRLNKDAELGPLCACLSTLAFLGAFLLLRRGAPDGSSLFWFLLFPPMIMFCLGLRRGSVAFFTFWFFLLLLMFPFRDFLAEPLPFTIRIRFLLAMLGAFIFSYGAEYIRFQTQKALVRTVARLELDSLTDSLTGLGNRRNFYNFCSISFFGSPASRHSFTLAVADIDRFKNINDTFGHEVGDKVLCHVAAILRGQCRETDKLYRWGGEEFLILMPRTSIAAALHVLERMRAKLEATPYRDDKGREISLTASFGLSERSAEENMDEQISAADKNLYAAKRGGRNLVVGPKVVY